MTAKRVALIDWDEAHVDVPDLDLVLPHNAAGSTTAPITSPRKRRPRGKPPSAGTTSTQSSGLPKFERSKQRQQIEKSDRQSLRALCVTARKGPPTGRPPLCHQLEISQSWNQHGQCESPHDPDEDGYCAERGKIGKHRRKRVVEGVAADASETT
jgi:hypothetical protein